METQNEDKNTVEEIPASHEDSSLSIVEEAAKLRDEIKAENDRREALIERDEQLQAKKMLGGHSQAGQEPQKPKPLTDKELTEKFLNGELEIL